MCTAHARDADCRKSSAQRFFFDSLRIIIRGAVLPMKVLFKNGLLLCNGAWTYRDLLMASGEVKCISEQIQPVSDEIVIDLDKKYILPGLADVHVHLREPGFSYKETIETGSAAAAIGGFTAVCPMPNLSPAPDTPQELERQIKMYEEKSCIRIVPYACITKGGTGKGGLLDYKAMYTLAAGFSDDGNGVISPRLMESAMAAIAETGGILAAHCEDKSITGGGVIHDGAYAAANGYMGIPSESEWMHVKRDLELVAKTGCNYHVCHVSSKESVELIRQAKKAGLPVTCETAPHYLVLDDSMLQDEGRFKMAPPIRSEQDRQALVNGIADGTIDMIATDHAPHSAEEKSGGLDGSLNGIVGLETSLALVYTNLVLPGIISMERLVQLMCTAPRHRFNLGGGEITEGGMADLIIFDQKAERTISSEDFLSMGKATPFEGRRVHGDVLLTVCSGNIVWDGLGLIKKGNAYG